MVAFLELEWDEDKRQATLKERGVDIAYAALIFLDDVFTRSDTRHDYGEERFVSVENGQRSMLRRCPHGAREHDAGNHRVERRPQ